MIEQEEINFALPDRPVRLFGTEKPADLNDIYLCNIRLVKTNGDALRASTGSIHFQ